MGLVGSNIASPHDSTRADVDNLPLLLMQGLGSDDGTITASTLGSGGSGYAPGDTGTISAGGNSDATYVVDTVNGGGAVLTYHLPNPQGTCYDTLSNPEGTTPGGSQPGSGSGLTINVMATNQPGDGDLYVTVDYRVIALH